MAISFLQTMATFNFSVNESGTRRLFSILLNQSMSLSVSKSWPSSLQDQIFDGRNIRTFGNEADIRSCTAHVRFRGKADVTVLHCTCLLLTQDCASASFSTKAIRTPMR